MSIIVNACRSVLIGPTTRTPLCILSSYKWKNYATDKTDEKDAENQNDSKGTEKGRSEILKKQSNVGIRQYIESKPIIKPRESPYVDLKSSKFISQEHTKKETDISRLLRHCLEESPNKEGFEKAVDIWISKNKNKQNNVDFIATAMKFMDAYKLEGEIEVYEKLLEAFPVGPFRNRTFFDVIMPKQTKQLFLALDLLTKLEWQRKYPSMKMHDKILEIFGPESIPLQKVFRLWFWHNEFHNYNPYKLDQSIYLNRIHVIMAAIERILGNNNGTKILELSAPIEGESFIDYDYFIVSSQTELHKKYITFCNPSNSIYIEGPTHIWINHVIEEYFIMKTGQQELTSTSEITIKPDEEREGVVLGLCFATRPYKETLQKWLAYMQDQNPVLRDFDVVFDVEGSIEDEQLVPPD